MDNVILIENHVTGTECSLFVIHGEYNSQVSDLNSSNKDSYETGLDADARPAGLD